MSALVAELVELARGDEGPQEPEDVRLDLVAAEAIERTRRNRPGVTFNPQLDESLVRGVPATIERAVSNLLDNAAKWSPPGGQVDVVVRDGELAVRDHGPGIADEDVPFIFDRFYRAPSARSMPGSGLGLAIVRQVADAHGGTIAVEAPEGGGTRMRSQAAFRERLARRLPIDESIGQCVFPIDKSIGFANVVHAYITPHNDLPPPKGETGENEAFLEAQARTPLRTLHRRDRGDGPRLRVAADLVERHEGGARASARNADVADGPVVAGVQRRGHRRGLRDDGLHRPSRVDGQRHGHGRRRRRTT